MWTYNTWTCIWVPSWVPELVICWKDLQLAGWTCSWVSGHILGESMARARAPCGGGIPNAQKGAEQVQDTYLI